MTRVALEGRAKPGEDGAAIKMYLKVRDRGFNPVLELTRREDCSPNRLDNSQRKYTAVPRYALFLFRVTYL